MTVRAASASFAPSYTRLYVLGDGSGWVLSHEAREICAVAQRLGLRASFVPSGSSFGIRRQKLFHTSRAVLPSLVGQREFTNRIALAYYHGKPNPAYPEFASDLEALRIIHPRLWRVQAPCRSMVDLLLETGIAPEKVHQIPLGINADYFSAQDPESRRKARAALGISEHAAVVGSFQKDGDGWGEGTSPKLIKGPDVLLAVLDRLRNRVPELHVLLSGAARGYVKHGLDQLGIPHTHLYLERYADMARLYQAVDLTLVTSREEGGPKAVLESMASGVPLVSTRVGQAADLVEHGRNGWLAEVEDVDALAHWAEVALSLGPAERAPVVQAGLATADRNTYESQLPLWRRFFAD